MTVTDLKSLFLRMGQGAQTLIAAAGCLMVVVACGLGIELSNNTRVVEMSNRVTELGKDSGKLVVELDLRGNMDAATIREVLEANQVPGVYRVALAE
jgi:hypothetical protein